MRRHPQKKKFLRQLSRARQQFSATLSDSPGHWLKMQWSAVVHQTSGAGSLQSASITSFPGDHYANSFENQGTEAMLMIGLRVWEMSSMGAQKGALVFREAEAARAASRADSGAEEEDPVGFAELCRDWALSSSLLKPYKTGANMPLQPGKTAWDTRGANCKWAGWATRWTQSLYLKSSL